jgi:hypothetical protein
MWPTVKGSIAIAGLVVGIIGLLLAMAVRKRWARPLGAFLLVVGVAAQVVALQSRSPSSAARDGSRFTPPPIDTTAPPPSSASPVPTFSIPPPVLRLLASVHPGTQPILHPGGVNKEFVKLLNPGTGDVAIGGWRLSNGSITFTFPSITLAAHQSLELHSGPGVNSSTDLYWNQTHYVWPASGTATLTNADGQEVQRCPYHAVPQGSGSC